MLTPYFKNLKNVVLEAIRQAQSNIKIAVAWFTDAEVLENLIQKCQSGVSVVLIISSDSKNFEESYSLDFSELSQVGGKIWVIDEQFMHQKFVIIDEKILLIGSVNFTYSGFHKNSENLLYIADEPEAIANFLEEFKRLSQNFEESTSIIISQEKGYLLAQIKLLNQQIVYYQSLIAEAQKQIEVYEIQYRLRFQTIIGQILYLQKLLAAKKVQQTEKPESKKQYEEAEYRWQTFNQNISKDTVQNAQISDVDLQQKLRQLYREGVKLCHPDNPQIAENDKTQAQEVFIALKNAFDENNLEKMQQIVEQLQLGIAFKKQDFSQSSVEQLKQIFDKLKQESEALMQEIAKNHEDKRYQVQQWASEHQAKYFEDEGTKLEEVLRSLKEKCK